MDTYAAVRRKGSMDEDIFIQTVLFYCSLYPNLSQRFKFSKDNTVFEGPIFVKMDSSLGRNCKSEQSIKFHRGIAMVFILGQDFQTLQVPLKKWMIGFKSSRAALILQLK